MIAGLLLAAGSSRRFGHGDSKLLQSLSGRPIARWSAETLAETAAPLYVVVPPGAAALRAALAGLDVRFVENPEPARGIGRSIACGIAALPHDAEAVLIAMADEPVLGRRPFDAVLAAYRDAAGSAPIIVPYYRGTRGHPVLFTRAVFDELRALDGDQGARVVTDRDPARVRRVDLHTEKPLDVDTREDLARLRSAVDDATLVSELMPQYDVRAEYGVNVAASPEVVYRAILETDLARSILARALMSLRMPARCSWSEFRFGALPRRGPFFQLAEAAPREIVAGVMGSFWRLRGNLVEGDRDQFFAPLRPGSARAAWSFRVDRDGPGSRLTTETRVLCADDASRRRLLRYWRVVGPFSGLIRREALRLIRARAQFMGSATR